MVFKRKKEYIYYRNVLPLLIYSGIALGVGLKWWLIIFVLLGILLLLAFNELKSKSLYSISIEPHEVTFRYYHNFRKRDKVCKPEEISFFNDPLSKGLSARGETRLSLYFKGKSVVKSLGEVLDGWSDEAIAGIIHQLEINGIRREKYFNWG